MTNYQDLFTEVENSWNLSKLYQDIANAKQKVTGKNRDITPLEKVCLRGLLSGYNPNDIAVIINREPRGLRVDLSRGLYRYLEILVTRPVNSLKDWRDVSFWLTEANYRYQLSNSDSMIKIVDVCLEGSIHEPLIDIKVRNTGSQPAFLKQAKFIFHSIWQLTSWVFLKTQTEEILETFPAPAMAREIAKKSRQVAPSFGYNFSLPDPKNHNYLESINISQCVGDRDVDRFTFSPSLPYNNCTDKIIQNTKFYDSYIYDLQIEIVYDEDDKLVRTPHILLLLENDYADAITERLFFSRHATISHDLQLTDKINSYSQQNKKILTAISQMDAVKSKFFQQIVEFF